MHGACGNALDVVPGLADMQAPGERVQLAIGLGRSPIGTCVMQYALDAAGHLQQLAIERFVPAPGKTDRRERRIECRAVTVALSVRESTVDVEDQRVQGHRSTLGFTYLNGVPHIGPARQHGRTVTVWSVRMCASVLTLPDTRRTLLRHSPRLDFR